LILIRGASWRDLIRTMSAPQQAASPHRDPTLAHRIFLAVTWIPDCCASASLRVRWCCSPCVAVSQESSRWRWFSELSKWPCEEAMSPSAPICQSWKPLIRPLSSGTQRGHPAQAPRPWPHIRERDHEGL